MDPESWYSVTPEAVSNHIAKICGKCKKSNIRVDDIIVDGCCGCGGNTIAFAKYSNLVIAVDIDVVKLRYLQNNSKIYNTEKKIQLIHGNVISVIKKYKFEF